MKDPERLFEAMAPEARAMIEAARDDGPSARSHRGAALALGLGSLGVAGSTVATSAAGASAGAGVGAGLTAAGAGLGTAGLGAAAGAGTGAGVAGAAAGGAVVTAGVAVKWVAVVAIVGGGSWGVAEVTASRGAAPPTVTVSAPTAAATTAVRAAHGVPGVLPLPGPTAAPILDAPPPPAVEQVLAPTSPARRSAPRGTQAVARETAPALLAPPPSPSPPAPTLESPLVTETRNLETARAAVQANDTARALTALDDYARAFPRGILGPEAAVLRIEALARRGRAEDRSAARDLAEAFLRAHATSPLSDRVRALLTQTSNP